MRLIDVDEALRLFDEEYKETNELIHNGETHLDNLAEGFAEAYHIIKYDLPTVDAVEVVRCKDCVHAEPYNRMDGLTGCYCGHPENGMTYGERWDRYFKPVKKADDYCSYWKRRER